MSTRHFEIKGAPRPPWLPSGAPPPTRLNITDLAKNQIQWSLFIRAIAIMVREGQNIPISHFQIGGIHGLPPQPWEGSGGTRPDGQWIGYCTHGTVLFPTWHRPYVALYEQVMQKHASDIAKELKGNEEWTKAADVLRLPFWDWATQAVPIPEVISLDELKIVKPGSGGKGVDSTPETVPNPLLAFKFNPIPPSFFGKYSDWPKTLRHPSNQTASASTDLPGLKADLGSHQNDWRNKTFRLLALVSTWDGMSNHTASQDQSLEGIHDSVHVSVGGLGGVVNGTRIYPGHMGVPAVAGFDPIFFLHHCNVDRLLALWQAIHYDVKISSGSSLSGTWTIPPNTQIDGKTGLTPFWNGPQTVWNSVEAASTQKLEYQYPEFVGLENASDEQLSREIALKVAALYGPGSILKTAPQPSAPPQLKSAPAAQKVLQQPAHQESQAGLWDWAARIRIKQYEFEGASFRVLVFLGDVPEDPHKWITSPNFVGSHAGFVNPVEGQCANCRDHDDAVTEGFVFLNDALVSHSQVNSFDPEVVEPYLKENLHWRIEKAGSEPPRNQDANSLIVDVVATWLTQGPGDVLPVAEKPVFHHAITHGRAGGHR